MIREEKESEYLNYERKLTDSGLSRWIVISKSSEFDVDHENIPILCDAIVNISIDGLTISKQVAEIWLEVNDRVVRSYTENNKYRLNWLKIIDAGDFSRLVM